MGKGWACRLPLLTASNERGTKKCLSFPLTRPTRLDRGPSKLLLDPLAIATFPGLASKYLPAHMPVGSDEALSTYDVACAVLSKLT